MLAGMMVDTKDAPVHIVTIKMPRMRMDDDIMNDENTSQVGAKQKGFQPSHPH